MAKKSARKRGGLEALIFGSTPGDKFRDKRGRSAERQDKRKSDFAVSGYAHSDRAAYDKKKGRVGAWHDDDSPIKRTKAKYRPI